LDRSQDPEVLIAAARLANRTSVKIRYELLEQLPIVGVSVPAHVN
jgi:hypothetical protein